MSASTFTSPLQTCREVAFIDTGIRDWRTLASGLRPGVEAVVLDGDGDGLAQIAAWLQGQRGRQGYAAIHLFSHGSPGRLHLGTLELDAATAEARAPELATLGAALAADGDLLVYGCEVARGPAGAAFVGRLAALAGATVAASEVLTGEKELGGSWALDAGIGAPAASLALSEAAMARFQGVLASTSTFDFEFGTGESPEANVHTWTQNGLTLKLTFSNNVENAIVYENSYNIDNDYLFEAYEDSGPISVTFSIEGYTFDFVSLNIANNETDGVATYKLTSSDAGDLLSGNVNYEDTGANNFSYVPLVSTSGFSGVSSITLQITDGDVNAGILAVFDDLVLDNIVAVSSNTAPTVTSGATASFAENGTGTVYTVTGSDPENDPLTFAISGGADAALFNIDGKTGAITFKSAPDYENPLDAGGNNIYDIEVTASDGKLSSDRPPLSGPVSMLVH